MDDFVIVQQEPEDELTHEYLVGPEKERAKGPPGRKLPHRKSMMPTDDARISGSRPLSYSSLIAEEDEAEAEVDNNGDEAFSEERKPVSAVRRPVGGIHAAFAKELETKLQKKRPPSQSSLDTEEENSVSTSVENRLAQLDSRMKVQEDQLQIITLKLKELDQLKSEYTKVLSEAYEARDLYQELTQKLVDSTLGLDKSSGSSANQGVEDD